MGMVQNKHKLWTCACVRKKGVFLAGGGVLRSARHGPVGGPGVPTFHAETGVRSSLLVCFRKSFILECKPQQATDKSKQLECTSSIDPE